MVKRLVSGFAKDLRGKDFADDFWLTSGLQDGENTSFGIEPRIDNNFR